MSADLRKRVLVVDDDPRVRALLVWILERHSLVVDQASDGQEALTLIQAHQHAVMILDLFMPVLDGFDVLAALDKRDDSPRPVVLVLTGADYLNVPHLDGRRVQGIVKKPFDPEELASVVVACTETYRRIDSGH